ncbi:hypothetical protein AB0J52_40485, partial [Spirillospora sp. NPDC049652]
LLRDARLTPAPVADAGPVAVPPQGRVLPNAAFPESDPYLLALLAAWREGPGEAEPVAAFLRRARRRGRFGERHPVLLAVDRAENWFTGRAPSARPAGLTELLAAVAADPGVRLMLSVRDERADDLLGVIARHGLPATEMRLGPLDRSAALDAVVEPARQAGRTFENGVAERLVDDLSVAHEEAAVEPVLLQAACRTLWDRLDGAGDTDDTVPGWLVPALEDILTDLCATVVGDVATGLDAAARSVNATSEDEWLALKKWERTPEDVARRAAEVPPHPKAAAAPVEEHARRRSAPSAAALHLLREAHLVKSVRVGRDETDVLRHPDLAPALSRLGDRPRRGRYRPDPHRRLRAAETALAAGQTLLARGLAGAAAGHPDTDAGFQADVQTVLGNIAYLHGRFDEAARCHQRAGELLQTVEDSAAVVLQLAAEGWARFAAGDADRGVALMLSGSDLAPAHACNHQGEGPGPPPARPREGPP